MEILAAAGVTVAPDPSRIGETMAKLLPAEAGAAAVDAR
jgi:hypothetical protein